jgi:hypothetical protein
LLRSLYPAALRAGIVAAMMWTLKVVPCPEGLHVTLSRWEERGPYPTQLLDFWSDPGADLTELGTLAAVCELARQAIVRRRLEA